MAKYSVRRSIIFKIPEIRMKWESYHTSTSPKLSVTSSLTVHDAIKPVYYILRPIALWPFKYNKNNKIRPLTAANKLFAYILLLVLISYYCYSTYYKITLMFSRGCPLLTISDVVYTLSSHILVAVSILTTNSKRGCLTKEFLVNIEQIRKAELFPTRDLRNSILLKTLAIIFTAALVNVSNIIVSVVGIGSRDIKGFLTTYIIQFLVLFHFLKVNMKVEMLLQYFRGVNRRFESCTNSQRELRELAEIHAKLCDLIELTNEAHGWEIVLLVVTTASKILNSLHLAVLHGLGEIMDDVEVELQAVIRVAQICTTAVHFGFIILLAAKCSRAKKEAWKTGLLANDRLLKIRADPHVLLYKEELKLFADQILYRQPNFSAVGIFNVDYSIISTVLGVVTSYFIVLLQLQN